MLRTIVYLLLLCVCISSCNEEAIIQTADPDKNVVELVAFGYADNPSEENKGFGVAYYFYLNLDTDSVFIQKRINPTDAPETLAWTGTIKGISEDKKIRDFINVSRETSNGFIIDTKLPELTLYSGYYYYSSYKDGNNLKYQFYTHHNLDERFRQAVDLIMNSYRSSQLIPVSSFIKSDSIIVPIVNTEKFSFRPPPPFDRPPPPPPVRVNYTPPLEKH